MTLLEFVSYAKKFCVALIAALGITATALSDGTITGTEWLQIVIAFVGALGVFGVTNSLTNK